MIFGKNLAKHFCLSQIYYNFSPHRRDAVEHCSMVLEATLGLYCEICSNFPSHSTSASGHTKIPMHDGVFSLRAIEDLSFYFSRQVVPSLLVPGTIPPYLIYARLATLLRITSLPSHDLFPTPHLTPTPHLYRASFANFLQKLLCAADPNWFYSLFIAFLAAAALLYCKFYKTSTVQKQ